MINFDFFINPNHHNFNSYDIIDFNSLNYCSYVRYIVISHINGEIDGIPILIEDHNELYNYIDGEFLVYALNYLDNILLEVKKL